MNQPICAACTSTDVQAQGHTFGCLNCGAVTDYEGNLRVGPGAKRIAGAGTVEVPAEVLDGS